LDAPVTIATLPVSLPILLSLLKQICAGFHLIATAKTNRRLMRCTGPPKDSLVLFL
jgi:hypothetical protein